MHPAFRFQPLPLAMVLFLALTFRPAGPASAAESRWQPAGPYGGSISALAVAPRLPRLLYAGTEEGLVFRSNNSGRTWAAATGDFPEARITDLAVDPDEPNTVYAAVCATSVEFGVQDGGVFKSVDGGRRWALLSGLPECEVLDLTIDPRSSRIYAASVAGLFFSDDGGATWRAGSGLARTGQVRAVALDPAASGTLYLLHTEHGFLRSTDGGATWVARNSFLSDPSYLAGLTAVPQSPGTLLISAFHDGPLFRSTNSGETWLRVGGVPFQYAYDLAAHPTSGALYLASDDGVFRSTDDGQSWLAPTAAVRGSRVLAVPSSPSGRVYAGHVLHGVSLSTDGGVSWSESNRGLTGLRVGDLAIPPAAPFHLYAATPDTSQIHRTFDGGRSWLPPAGGGPFTGDFPITFHPFHSHLLYAAGFLGSILVSENGGGAWRQLTGPATACMATRDLAVDPQNPDNLYAVGDKSVSCPPEANPCLAFKSNDAGETWSCMQDLPATADLLTVALAPSDPAILYTGTSGASIPPVFKSTDGGEDWQRRSAGLPRRFVASLTVSPQDPQTVYALTAAGLYKTTNGGAAWAPSGNGLPPAPVAFFSEPFLVPTRPNQLYIIASVHAPGARQATSTVYRSLNGGATWNALTRAGLPQGAFGAVRVSPRAGEVYVSTRFGIYKLPVPTPR